METTKLVIYMPIMDQFVRYDDRIITFDTEEEVANFKAEFAEFFKQSPGASVTKPVGNDFLGANLVVAYTEISSEDLAKEKAIVDGTDEPSPAPTKEEMYNLLNTTFSPDKVAGLMPSVFARDLIEHGIISSMADLNYLALEAIQHAFVDDDEFPIHYYRKGEEMSEAGRVVNDIGDCLTDDYIATNLANPT